ncbi:MAG: winged helix-turn-helix transcriptional regulator [Gemmatimonadetes bacterium]|nr:winged helix-turn-helix transcriptional regulator [Gemmatimonadota bacterium]
MLTLSALADPTRRRIVEMLARGALSAGSISERFTISPSAVSQHLKVLREAKLVTVRAAAQQRIYELDSTGLIELDAWLDGIWPLWQKRLEAIERERVAGAERRLPFGRETREEDG